MLWNRNQLWVTVSNAKTFHVVVTGGVTKDSAFVHRDSPVTDATSIVRQVDGATIVKNSVTVESLEHVRRWPEFANAVWAIPDRNASLSALQVISV